MTIPSPVITQTNQTTLVLGGISFPMGAARGITQTLEPIDNGPLRRDINGTLFDLTIPEQRKFKSTVSCTDRAVPALAPLWKGTVVAVTCAKTLVEQTATSTITLQRNPPSPDSVWAYTPDGTDLTIASVTMGINGLGAVVVLDAFPTGETTAIVEYQPALSMRVSAPWRSEFREWEAVQSWSLDLEEV